MPNEQPAAYTAQPGSAQWYRNERERLLVTLDLIATQVSLYEMSYSDTLGPSAESFMACIANILEYGHPAGEADG